MFGVEPKNRKYLRIIMLCLCYVASVGQNEKMSVVKDNTTKSLIRSDSFFTVIQLKINWGKIVSPSCICSAESEAFNYLYLLMSPLYAAQRFEMLLCTANLFAEWWGTTSDSARMSAFIYGSP